MGIDINAIRKKLAQISGKNNRTNVMWRPQEGEETTIRILAFPNNDGQPFKELYFYYNIGNNPGLLAPYQYQKPDPIQELISKLREDGSKESYEMAKKLYPKMRCYAPVIVRGEEDKGVRIWAFGKTVYQSLLNIMLDEDYGDITDPEEGFDIKVTCTKAPGRQWATTEVRPRPRPTALSKNSAKSKQWLNEIPDISELYSCKSYDELSKIVNDWLNDGDEDAVDDTPSTGTSRGGDGTTSKSYKSLNDAFSELEDL